MQQVGVHLHTHTLTPQEGPLLRGRLGGNGRLTPPSLTGRRLREEGGLEPVSRVEYTTAFKVTGGSHSPSGNPGAKETGQERVEGGQLQ